MSTKKQYTMTGRAYLYVVCSVDSRLNLVLLCECPNSNTFSLMISDGAIFLPNADKALFSKYQNSWP